MDAHDFVLLQLAFNTLMFVALVALAWRTRDRRARAPRRAEVHIADAANAPGPALRTVAARPAPALDDLVAQAEQKELAAEAALRARLARFKDRAAV